MTSGRTAPKPLPSREALIAMFDYEQATGTLVWKRRLENGIGVASFNARFAGKPALNNISKQGYRRGCVKGSYLYAHRVIWKMETGEDPVVIDHIDGDTLNNKYSNLRSVSQAENSRNASRRTDNSSGVTGVTWDRRSLRWVAEVNYNGTHKHLGQFEQIADAIACRKAADAELGFHQNHGKKAA